MDRPRPTCPTCGTTDERSPDAFGVHRCSACAIEFRPPIRMPIRRASVNKMADEAASYALALVIIGVLVMLVNFFGDYRAATSSSPPYMIEPYRPPVFEPIQLDPLEHLDELQFEAPLARIPLEYELHVKQVTSGQLFATGLLRASEPVEAISLEVECRDLAGAPLGTLYGVVSCKAMQPGERCAWMLEGKTPRPIAEIELRPSARRALGLEPPQLDLRSDRADELRFDANKRTLKFELRERTLSEAWATVTAYSPEGRVLGVAETRFGGRHPPGRHRFEVVLPKSPDEVGYYEARLGGRLSEW